MFSGERQCTIYWISNASIFQLSLQYMRVNYVLTHYQINVSCDKVNLSAIDVCLYIQHILCQSFDLNMHFVAMSDCCLTPYIQFFIYIMARASLY